MFFSIGKIRLIEGIWKFEFGYIKSLTLLWNVFSSRLLVKLMLHNTFLCICVISGPHMCTYCRPNLKTGNGHFNRFATSAQHLPIFGAGLDILMRFIVTWEVENKDTLLLTSRQTCYQENITGKVYIISLNSTVSKLHTTQFGFSFQFSAVLVFWQA